MAPLSAATLPDVQSLLPTGEDSNTVSVTAIVTGYTASSVDRLAITDVSLQERESGVGEEAQNGLMVASPVCALAETTQAQARKLPQ